jgi:hypothetical protein
MKFRAEVQDPNPSDLDRQNLSWDYASVKEWAVERAKSTGKCVKIFETVEVLKLTVCPPAEPAPDSDLVCLCGVHETCPIHGQKHLVGRPKAKAS